MARSREIIPLLAFSVTLLTTGITVDRHATAQTNPDVYVKRGEAYFDKGQFERAIAAFTQAIKLNPKNARTYSRRGAAFFNKHDHDRAMADFSQAIRLDPKFAKAYISRGLVYYKVSGGLLPHFVAPGLRA